MIVEKKILTKIQISTLQVSAHVRYWEDGEVNGVEDTDGDLMPFANGNTWGPTINIDTGIIKDWPKGTSASIHYKVVDEGTYRLFDENGQEVGAIEDDYVPGIMCPGGDGYGDYIIMEIDENGQIQDWTNEDSLDEFFDQEDC